MIAEARARIADGLATALPAGTRIVAYAVSLDDLSTPTVVVAATTLDATDTACPGVKVVVEAFVVSHKIEPGVADDLIDPLADAALNAPIVGVAFRTGRRSTYLGTHPAWLLTWEVIGMTGIGHVVKTMIVKIDTVAYECAVTAVTPTPNFSTSTLETACPNGVITDVGPTSWTVTIDYAVDWDNASLHRLLNDPLNDGKAAVLLWTPDPIGEPLVTQTFNVKLKPGSAPHRVGAFATASVTLPVAGAPVTTDTEVP